MHLSELCNYRELLATSCIKLLELMHCEMQRKELQTTDVNASKAVIVVGLPSKGATRDTSHTSFAWPEVTPIFAAFRQS